MSPQVLLDHRNKGVTVQIRWYLNSGFSWGVQALPGLQAALESDTLAIIYLLAVSKTSSGLQIPYQVLSMKYPFFGGIPYIAVHYCCQLDILASDGSPSITADRPEIYPCSRRKPPTAL